MEETTDDGNLGPFCVPGNRLSVASKQYVSGQGTYIRNKFIHASLAGLVKVTQLPETDVNIVSVQSPRAPGIIPKMGDVVTCKVTMVNSRQVTCAIICVGTNILHRPFRGILKKEEIRKTDRDRVDPYKCFRPGDIILARVLPITEMHSYHLTTAENDLGVVIASADGVSQDVNMIPISWSEMQCPETLIKEPRKVAQVLPEKLSGTIFTTRPRDDSNLTLND